MIIDWAVADAAGRLPIWYDGASVDNRDFTNMKHEQQQKYLKYFQREKEKHRKRDRKTDVQNVHVQLHAYTHSQSLTESVLCVRVFKAHSQFPEKPEQKRLGACSRHRLPIIV